MVDTSWNQSDCNIADLNVFLLAGCCKATFDSLYNLKSDFQV